MIPKIMKSLYGLLIILLKVLFLIALFQVFGRKCFEANKETSQSCVCGLFNKIAAKN